jgi:hypothetical protein
MEEGEALEQRWNSAGTALEEALHARGAQGGCFRCDSPEHPEHPEHPLLGRQANIRPPRIGSQGIVPLVPKLESR